MGELCSLPGSCLAWDEPVLGSTGCMVGLTSKRLTPARLTAASVPVPMVSPCWPRPSQENLSSTNKDILIQSPVGSLLLSSGSWCMQDFVCELQDWSLCFPQSCGSPIIKFHWPSRSDSLRISSPFVRSPGWEAWCWVQNLHNGGRTSLVLLFSRLWVSHLVGMGFDFIMIVPLLPSPSGFFVTGHWVSFFGGFQHSPVNGCSEDNCNFGALAEGDEHMSFSVILNWKPTLVFLPGKSHGQRSWLLQLIGLQRARRNWATNTHTWWEEAEEVPFSPSLLGYVFFSGCSIFSSAFSVLKWLCDFSGHIVNWLVFRCFSDLAFVG